MRIRATVEFDLVEEERFPLNARGSNYLASMVLYEPGADTVTLYAHRVYSNGRMAFNAIPLVDRSLNAVPPWLREKLEAIEVSCSGTERNHR